MHCSCEGLCADVRLLLFAVVSFLHCRCSRAAGHAAEPRLLHVSLLPLCPRMALRCHHLPMASAIFYLQLSAMDVSVRTTMKGAAKCDKHCELQNSVNRQGLERILCFWDIPESMPASVSMLSCSSSSATPGTAAASACASRCILVVLLRHSTDKASVRLPAY